MGEDYPKPKGRSPKAQDTRLSPNARCLVPKHHRKTRRRSRKTTGRSRQTKEDYGKKPEDYRRLREEAGEGPEIQRSRDPEIQKSRNPEIQRSRNPEIQKSRNPADVETSPKSRPKGHIYIYIHNHIQIQLTESISTKATQNTPPPCRKHGPFWTRHGVGGFLVHFQIPPNSSNSHQHDLPSSPS